VVLMAKRHWLRLANPSVSDERGSLNRVADPD